MRRCGMRDAAYTNQSRASNSTKVPSRTAPSASLLQLAADFLRLVHSFQRVPYKNPTHPVGQPVSFAPYILQPTLLWYVTQMVEKSVSSWILYSTTN